MKSDNIDKEYDSEKAKLETEFAEKLADLKENRDKAKATISDKKLNLRLATDLWTKGKSRMEIAQILEVPNDAVLSLMIRGHYKDSVESHTRREASYTKRRKPIHVQLATQTSKDYQERKKMMIGKYGLTEFEKTKLEEEHSMKQIN